LGGGLAVLHKGPWRSRLSSSPGIFAGARCGRADGPLCCRGGEEYEIEEKGEDDAEDQADEDAEEEGDDDDDEEEQE